MIRRPCEVEAKRLIAGLSPQPTMGLAIITARAIALPARDAPRESKTEFYNQVVASLSAEVRGLDRWPICAESDDVFDALIAAYTGSLHPDRLEEPPEGFNIASGWIRFRKAASV